MWVILSLVSALTLATGDALTKKALRGANEYLIGWLRLLFAVPVFLSVLFFIERPPLDSAFYRAFITALPLEVLAFMLYIKALRVSPLGLTIPFLAFTPLFLIGASYIILGEQVSSRGVVGILLLAAGSYALNFHHLDKGLLEPLKAVFREKGSLMMLSVAFIFSFTVSLGKMAINHSSPLFFGATYFIALTFVYTPFALPGIKKASITKAGLKTMLFIGIFTSMSVIFHMLAISMAKVAYMVAVKRTSLLFSVFYGYLFFRESHIKERLLGAVLMLAGFVLVVTAA